MPGVYLGETRVQEESVPGHACIQIHKAGSIYDLHYISGTDVSSFCRQAVRNSLFLLFLSDMESAFLLSYSSAVSLRKNK